MVNITQISRRVIEQEVLALQSTISVVESDEFVRAVEMIDVGTYCTNMCCNNVKGAVGKPGTGGGRLVVMGVGKSGNVGAKLSASFASLGVHSHYLHATEAAHGGLGGISTHDVVLMVSNSGATPELIGIIASLKLINCKMILLSGDANSPLGKAVDINIAYGKLTEADSHNLAPTCSSTAAMAVGDALAVTISTLRGFSKWDFGMRHPGGALGQAVLGADFAQLRENKQTHVLDHLSSLSSVEKEVLHNNIQEVDLEHLSELFETATIPKQVEVEKMAPFPDVVTLANLPADEVEEYKNIGLEMIANGEVATVVLAGGQATRAGLSYPKGLLDVHLPSHRSLFEMQVASSLKLQNLASKHFNRDDIPQIPFYAMVNKDTHQLIQEYFEANKYFGLQTQNFVLFDQGTMPCLDFNGKLLLEEKHKIARAPDGHGGLYEAMHKSQIIQHMKQRNIKFVFVYSVDNLLVKMADPVFIGFCASKGCDFGYKVVNKLYPTEPAGIVCMLDNKTNYVEHTELPPSLAHLRDGKTGNLIYNAANILNLYYTLPFLENVVENHAQLKYHVSKKRVQHVNAAGKTVMPDKPNAYKFEKIVLDCTPHANNVAVFMVDRKSDFAPIKNSWGCEVDSPNTARVMLSELHKNYIVTNGGKVHGDAAVEMCEILPRFTYAGEGLTDIVKGADFLLPLVLGANPSTPDLKLSR